MAHRRAREVDADLIYRIEGEEVPILRVMRGSRDIRALLRH